MTGLEEPHVSPSGSAGESSPIDRFLTGAGQILLVVTLVGIAIATAFWHQATNLDTDAIAMPGVIWRGIRLGVTLGFFVAAAAMLERLGVPIYRNDEEGGGKSRRVWLGVLGLSWAVSLLTRLLLAWDR